MTPEDRIESPESPQSLAMVQGKRRRLLRGGLAAAPALLTLVNGSVMAQACSTASAHGSAGSQHNRAQLRCTGASPGTWSRESSVNDWPAPLAMPDTSKTIEAPVATETPSMAATAVAAPSTLTDGPVATASSTKTVKVPGTTFDSVFGRQGGYGTKTLTEVLRLNSNGGRDGLARHLVAAYLNALKGLTPREVLDVPTIKSIWTSFIARGYYEPTAGIRWFPDYAEPASPRGGLIAWLKTTMPA